MHLVFIPYYQRFMYCWLTLSVPIFKTFEPISCKKKKPNTLYKHLLHISSFDWHWLVLVQFELCSNKVICLLLLATRRGWRPTTCVMDFRYKHCHLWKIYQMSWNELSGVRCMDQSYKKLSIKLLGRYFLMSEKLLTNTFPLKFCHECPEIKSALGGNRIQSALLKSGMYNLRKLQTLRLLRRLPPKEMSFTFT